jgi:hypothetical protein
MVGITLSDPMLIGYKVGWLLTALLVVGLASYLVPHWKKKSID